MCTRHETDLNLCLWGVFFYSNHDVKESTLCVLCTEAVDKEEAVILTEKGSENINAISRCRNEELNTKPSQTIHERCRVLYIHPHYIQKDMLKRKSQITLDSTPSKLRSRQKFNFQNDCLFCGQNVVKQGTREKWHPVLTLEFQSTLLGVCKRRNDDWARIIEGRIASVGDLHAADAVYHHICSTNFRTSRGIPKKCSSGIILSVKLTLEDPKLRFSLK